MLLCAEIIQNIHLIIPFFIKLSGLWNWLTYDIVSDEVLSSKTYVENHSYLSDFTGFVRTAERL
jgi:hypothetical protein